MSKIFDFVKPGVINRILALAETNAQLEKLDAEGRVAWALDNLPGEYVLSSSFGIQAAVSLHLVNQIRPDIPVILTDTGYLFPETYRFIDELTVDAWQMTSIEAHVYNWANDLHNFTNIITHRQMSPYLLQGISATNDFIP